MSPLTYTVEGFAKAATQKKEKKTVKNLLCESHNFCRKMEELTLGKLGKCEKKRLCRLSMPAPKKSTGLNSGDKRFTQEKQT
jgi:hypothetical protein